jgi:hypothetical protein
LVAVLEVVPQVMVDHIVMVVEAAALVHIEQEPLQFQDHHQHLYKLVLVVVDLLKVLHPALMA